MEARFAGRVAIVTGGGRGIGRAVAEALAADGARVAALARSTSQVEDVAFATGGIGVACDVADETSVAAAVGEVVERLGPPSLVVCAAGISPAYARAERHPVADVDRILDVNVGGAFSVVHAAAPHLLASGGAVVLVASTTALRSSPRLIGYGASKAAVVHLARTLAHEWGDRGVRVNAICPGYVETDMTEALLASRHRETIVGDTPMGRLAEMREVVEPTLFLLSDAASYITGAALAVDGGMAA